jgi:hypothetical protein
MRFSLRWLFIVVAFAAFAVGAALAKSLWLISPFVTFTLGLLCWAFLERQSRFWRGLCVFGIPYLAIAVLPPFSAVSPFLPSTRLHTAIADNDVQPAPLENPFDPAPLQNPFADPFGDLAPVMWLGGLIVFHCIGAILFGAFGGLLYQWHSERRKASSS